MRVCVCVHVCACICVCIRIYAHRCTLGFIIDCTIYNRVCSTQFTNKNKLYSTPWKFHIYSTESHGKGLLILAPSPRTCSQRTLTRMSEGSSRLVGIVLYLKESDKTDMTKCSSSVKETCAFILGLFTTEQPQTGHSLMLNLHC